MKKKPLSSRKASGLLEVLAQTPGRPTPLPQEHPPQKEAPHQVAVPDADKAEKRSKAIAISLHPQDREKIRELSLWFSAQGAKITDSMIIRCALRLAEPGSALMDAYQQARQLDQRIKKRTP